MKRWNAETKQWERVDAEATPKAQESEGLDAALEAAFEQALSAPGAVAVAQSGGASAAAQADVVAAPVVAGGVPVAGPADRNGADAGADLDDGPREARPELSADALEFDVPGLTRGKKVRERMLRTGGRRAAQQVRVTARSARPSGPAVRETTAVRQKKAATPKVVREETAPKQRYVNRPAPELLSGRPKWVQDLFEAHFRSDMTLGLRRQYNRMKISRQDYAIGWLTLLDKIREDPNIARLDGRGSGA